MNCLISGELEDGVGINRYRVWCSFLARMVQLVDEKS